MMEHSKDMSPSSGPAIMQCAHFESDSGGSDAKKGNVLHECCESILHYIDVEHLDYSLCAVLGLDIKESEYQACFDVVNSLIAEITNRYGEIIAISTEKRVDIYSGNKLLTFGTLDIYFLCENGQCIVDLKSGFDFDINKVDYRYQTCWYATGIMQELRLPKMDVIEWYIMPNRYIDYSFTYDEATALCEAVYNKKKDKGNQECHINYFCRHCVKMGSCKKFMKGIKVIEENWAVTEKLKSASDITDPIEMGDALNYIKYVVSPFISKLEGISKDIKKAAVEMMKEKDIDGWKVSQKTTNELVDVSEGFNLMSHYLSDEEFISCSKTSVSQLQRLYYEKFKKSEKTTIKASKEAVLSILKPVLEQKTTFSVREVKK